MKAKTIFKSAMVGLLSLSLFLSGMPVMATELKDKLSEQRTEPELDERKNNTDLNQNLEKDIKEDITVIEEIADKKEQIEETKTQEEIKIEEEMNTEEVEEVKNTPLKVLDGNIVIDGNLSDWEKVTTHSSEAANVDSFQVAYSPDGKMLYFCYRGNASTEWDYSFASTSNSFYFSYLDGATGENSSISINAWKDGALVKNSFWGDILGADIAVTNKAHGTNAGPYAVEFSVPVTFFHSLDFILTFGDTSINSRDIEQINGNIVEEEKPVIYTGITIDGNYSDWAAVKKT